MAITELEFAERVKSKYPQYKNIDDAELVSLVLDRYPEYKTRLGEKEYSKNLLTNSAKTLISGGVQAAINAGAGVQQSYSMLLGDKSDTSEEAVKEYASQRRVKQRKGGSRMAQGKILAHRKRKNELIQTLNENAHRLRNLANSTDERFNIDPEFANTFGGQVLKGFGQMVSNIGSLVVGTAVAGPVGGVATAVGTIAPQMVSEAVSDAEATLGKSYMDMTEEEKEGVALTTASYTVFGTALEFVPAARIPWVKNFLRGKTKVAAGELKSPVIRREIAKGFAAEGFTEAAQGQLLDSLARATFDDDRELMSWDVLRQRFNEFAVGGVVGGGTRGGIATIQKAAQGDLFKPKETKEVQTDGITKEVFEVSYTDQNTGQPVSIEIDAENQEDATRIAGERLAGLATEGTIVARPKPSPEIAGLQPEVTAEAAVVGLTPKEFTSRLKDTKVVDDQGKPLRVFRGTRNIEFETKGRGRIASFTSSPDIASTYSSTISGGPFNLRLSFKEGASVSPVFLSMKKPLDFTAEDNLMSLGNYLAYMEYGNDKGITKEEVDKLINYMVNRGRGRTKAKDAFVFRLDDSFTTPEDRGFDFSRDEYSDLLEFKDEYDSGLSLEDNIIQEGLYFDQFIAADAPVTQRVAERLGFDGIIHKDAFGLKEEYEQLTGKKVEGLTQETREDGLSTIEDDIHITYRPFSEEQVIGSFQKPDVTARAAPVEPEITSDEVLTDEQVQEGVESEHGATVQGDIDGDVFAGAAPVAAPSQQAAPIITRASLAGKKLFAYFSDRTRVGTYTGINPDSGISIDLQGGPMYPFMGNNKEKKAGWAFSSEGMFTRFLNRVKKTDGIGLVTLYSKENLRANLTFLKAYVAEVKYAIEQGTITEQRFLEVANNLRKAAVQSVKKTGKSLDKPFESIEDFEKGLEDSTFDVRATAFFGYSKNKKGENKGSKIGSDALVDEGFPNISTMVDLFADPSFDELEAGTIVSAVQFDQNQDGPTTATTLGVDEHLSYKVVIKGEGIGFFSDPVLVSDVIPSRGRTRRNITRSAETSMADVEFQADEVTAQAAPVDGPGQPTPSQVEANRIQKRIEDNFGEIASKIGTSINVNTGIETAGRYNASTGVIEINPEKIVELYAAGQVDIVNDAYITSVMREEIIHAAMSKVILKKSKGKKEGEAFQSFMESLGKSLTPQQRNAIQQVYQGLETDAQFGAEYSRAAIQQLLYGNVTESFITQGPAFAKIKALLKSVQAYIAKTFKADVTTDPEAAAIIVESARLLQAVDPNAKPVEQKAIDKAMAYSQDVNPNAEVTSQQVAESGKPPSEKKLNVNFARKYLFTVSSLLNSIHPRLKELIRRYYSSIQGEVLDYQKRVAPFFKKYRGIKNADDRKRLKQLLSYSPVRQEGVDPLIEKRDALLRKYDLFNDYQLEIRPVLNELYNRLQDEGIMVGFLEEYFPRSIKDLEKVKNRAGPELRDAFREFIKARNKRIEDARGRIEEGNPRSGDVELSKETTIQIGNPKTAALEAQQWDQFTRGFNAQGRRNLPGNFLSRSQELEIIPDNLLDAYEDPGAAMERYIYNAVTAIQSTRLMGSKFANVPEGLKVPPASELGLLIQELRANGEISMEDADGTVPDIFAMILSPVQVENIYFQLARSFGYGTLLVEFTSTLSQLYDLPFIMLDNGIFGTAVAMFGPRLKGDDFGIDVNQVSVEFASDNRVLEKAVRLGLRASGFTKLDQVMKETNLTANYNRYRKLARGYFKDRNSANSKKFIAELISMGYGEAEQRKLIAALKDDDRNSAYVRNLLLNKLAETQPLTKAEMALGIVNNPNLRFTVAMKSFMIKQLNFVKDRMINEFIDGVRTNNARKIKKASSDLALLMTFLLLIGLPVDALKDFLAGRLGYMSDYLFNGVFRIAGISRYTTYQARKEGVGQAAFDYVTPVAIQQFVDATSELDRVVRGERAITESKFVTLLPFSDVINRIFGFQQGRERKEYMRRIKEGESPFIIPPGAL